MLRRLLLLGALGALALVPAAVADGGGPAAGTIDGGVGVVNGGGTLRFVSVQAPLANSTVVEAVQTSDGQVVQSASLFGLYGIPLVTQDGHTGGLSADGKTLVLADGTFPTLGYRTASHFAIFDARSLARGVQVITLAGDYAYDALSPNGRWLYLIQHVAPQQNLGRYVVRAYDLEYGRLLPRKIADRTQKGWVMQGYPMARATSADGRFVYTLYQNPGGYPFVHALDTVTMTAHCVGVPWKGSADQAALWNVRLHLRDGGRTLALDWRSGRHYLAIDTRSYRVSYPHASFPWAAVLGGSLGGAVLLLLGSAGLLRRRRRLAAPSAEFEAFLREQRERESLGAAGD
jgi:hypothetical protein